LNLEEFRRRIGISAAHEQAGRSPIFDEVIRHRDLFFIVKGDFQWGPRRRIDLSRGNFSERLRRA
jgi:hypothetical protein